MAVTLNAAVWPVVTVMLDGWPLIAGIVAAVAGTISMAARIGLSLRCTKRIVNWWFVTETVADLIKA